MGVNRFGWMKREASGDPVAKEERFVVPVCRIPDNAPLLFILIYGHNPFPSMAIISTTLPNA
jgi:hypothetical protein